MSRYQARPQGEQDSWCKNSPRLSTQFPTHRCHPAFVHLIDFPVAHTNTHLMTSSLDAPLTDGNATLRILSHRSSAHFITSQTHDWHNRRLAISVSIAHVHTVRAPRPEDKACPSNLLVFRDAPVQSQHMHSAGARQPTITLRSGEHSVFYTTLSPIFVWSSWPIPHLASHRES